MSMLDALLLEPYPFDVWIAYRTDGLKGSGTASDPWDGSTAALFDSVMASLPANVCVHLGACPRDAQNNVIPFKTNGYADGVSGGWQAKPGMRIVGSGIGVTTLQLQPGGTAGTHYFAVGHPLSSGTPPNLTANPVDCFELSDLTIDCNLGTSSVACGAVRVMGSHVKIHRVKAVHWGNNAGSALGFVFAVIAGDPDTGASVRHSGLESCVALEPAESGTATPGDVLVFHAGGKSQDATQKEAYGLGLYIRNCVVDGGTLGTGNDFRAKLEGLSISSCRAGVAEGNHVLNLWTGGPCLGRWSVRDVVLRNSFFKNVVKGPCGDAGTLGSAISITSLVRAEPSPAKTAEATTSADHPLAEGDRVQVSGSSTAEFNGVFVVSSVPASNKFRYEMESRPSTDGGTGTMRKVIGVDKVILDANIVELSNAEGLSETPVAFRFDANATPSIPVAYVYGDVILRRNVIRYVDGKYDSNYTGTGIDVRGAKNLNALDNVVECAPANPVRNNDDCGAVNYFNNKTPSGVLVQGWNSDTSRKYDELETEAEDAFVLAFLEKQ